MLNVLKHDFLTALVLDNALVIRQIECCRPHTVVAVTGRKHLIDDTNRRDRAESWIAVGRIDRQVVLDFLEVIRKALDFCSFYVVLQADIRLERSLVSEEFISICFIWSDRDINGRIQVHPRDVTLVVVVVKERSSSSFEETFERYVLCQPRGFA